MIAVIGVAAVCVVVTLLFGLMAWAAAQNDDAIEEAEQAKLKRIVDRSEADRAVGGAPPRYVPTSEILAGRRGTR